MNSTNTKELLLDTAERLFAERGIKETSVRDITRAANTHLASVNYHFSSKDGLIRTIIARRIEPLNRERFKLLDSFESEADNESIPLEKLLYALFAPSFKMYIENPYFLRLAGRMISDPDKREHRIFASQFEQVFKRIKYHLTASSPDVPEKEIMWRMHFSIGAMIHTWTNHCDLETRSRGLCNITDKEEIVNRLVVFCAHGLRAPIA